MAKKTGAIIPVFVLLFIVPGWVRSQDIFDRRGFYKAMESGDARVIDKELKLLGETDFEGKQPFEGCLLMKKAGMIGPAAKKLSLFKTGRRELEGVILMDSMNAEYRFLRLMIQEHAPAIVGYRKDLHRDQVLIIKYYKTLQQEVRDAIIDYSRKSTILKPADF
jgi:hypothetical protein